MAKKADGTDEHVSREQVAAEQRQETPAPTNGNGMPPLDGAEDLKTAYILLARFKRELAKAFPSESETHARWREWVVKSLAVSGGK